VKDQLGRVIAGLVFFRGLKYNKRKESREKM